MFNDADLELQDRATGKLIYRNYSASLFDGEKIKLKGRGGARIYAHQLNQLECFVHDVLSNDEIPFVPRFSDLDGVKYDHSPLAARYFMMMPGFILTVEMLSLKYEYNEKITIFVDCCNFMGLMSSPVDWRAAGINFSPPTHPHVADGHRACMLFNELVNKIRIEWRRQNFKERYRIRCREARVRVTEYFSYVDALFDDCKRLVVLRLDFFYKEEYFDQVDIHDALEDLNHLFRNKRCNSLFRFMKGYIAKVEYGIQKSLHFHTIFFFDGSKRNNSSHIYSAKQIGEYWVNTVTKGRGAYWNSNNETENFDRLGIRGIGVINANELQLRNNLKFNVVHYLCKIDQYFRPKFGTKVKLIRRGGLPKKRPIKLGRRRKIDQVAQT